MSQLPKVSVAVRVRPVLAHGGGTIHQQERFSPLVATRHGDHNLELQEHNVDEACKSSSFTFDHIFDTDATQLDIYEEAVVDLIDAALMGHNATIMAYGQTGSGKTHTVLGDVKPNPLEDDLLTPESGIFLRVLNELLEYKRHREKEMHVIIGLSCVEIYCDQIRDLFGGKPEDKPPVLKVTLIDDQVLMKDLNVKEVTSMQSVFQEVQLAIGRRKSRATESNQTSSRSHCLFMIDVLQIEKKHTKEEPSLDLLTQHSHDSASRGGKGGSSSRSNSAQPSASGWHGTICRMPDVAEPVRCSKILIADLAGSEKIATSGVTGDGLAEATSINSSLTALGNVVHELYQGGHVSYRTSNLTRLLKPTFSQKTAKVLLLTQISPTQITFAESVNTMHFANKAKAMKVVTTLGAESDRLEHEALEMQKVHASALADLHITTAEFGCPPSLLKLGMSRLEPKYKVVDASLVRTALLKTTAAHHNERADRLTEIGAVQEYEQMREDYVKSVAEALQLEKEKQPQYVKEIVGEHQDNRSQLEEQLASAFSEAAQVIESEQRANRHSLNEDEKSAYSELVLAEAESAKAAMIAYDTKVEEELTAILAVPLPRAVAADKGRLEDDEAYANSTWAHGTGRRFLNSFLEVRDAQNALQIAELNRLKLEVWIRKHQPKAMEALDAEEKKSSSSSEKHADPNSGAAGN